MQIAESRVVTCTLRDQKASNAIVRIVDNDQLAPQRCHPTRPAYARNRLCKRPCIAGCAHDDGNIEAVIHT
jgi:hypothetical protein